MRDWFYKYASIVLIAGSATIWLTVFIIHDLTFLRTRLLLKWCIIGQLLLVFLCGILIQKLYKQANSDSLTGVSNRRCFFSKLSVISKIKFPVSLLLIDLDDFKRINDNHGHVAGDDVLKQIAKIFQSNIRSTDLIARWGGEEFAVILPKTNQENAFKLAERLKSAVEVYNFSIGTATVKMTISIGSATIQIPMTIDCFLKLADNALYKAKETKNVVVAYDQI